MARTEPTDEHPREVMRIALSGLASGTDIGEIAERLASFHPPRNAFPADVLLELAADALEYSGASRANPIRTERIRQRFLPEDSAHTRAQHYKAEWAISAAAMLRGGVDPATGYTASGWVADDAWFWVFEALVIYVRAAAEHTNTTVAVTCHGIATRHGIKLSGTS